MYRGNFDIVTANEVVISEKEITMNLAVVVLLMVYVSLCVVVIGGWAFKTMKDVGIEVESFDDDDVDFPTENENEQGNLL